MSSNRNASNLRASRAAARAAAPVGKPSSLAWANDARCSNDPRDCIRAALRTHDELAKTLSNSSVERNGCLDDKSACDLAFVGIIGPDPPDLRSVDGELDDPAEEERESRLPVFDNVGKDTVLIGGAFALSSARRDMCLARISVSACHKMSGNGMSSFLKSGLLKAFETSDPDGDDGDDDGGPDSILLVRRRSDIL